MVSTAYNYLKGIFGDKKAQESNKYVIELKFEESEEIRLFTLINYNYNKLKFKINGIG